MVSIDYAELAKKAEDAGYGGSGGFDPIPDGRYEVEVTGAKYKEASTGSPMYEVELTVTSGPYSRRKVWDNLVLKLDNPQSVNIFFQKLNTIGLGTAFFTSAKDTDTVCAELLDKKVTVNVGSREYKDVVRNSVKSYVSSGGSSPRSPGTPAPAPAFPSSPGLPPGL